MDAAILADQKGALVMAIDYSLGRKCYLEAWMGLNPGKPEPRISKYQDDLKGSMNREVKSSKSLMPLWKTRESTCDRKLWDSFVRDTARLHSSAQNQLSENASVRR
jgi:hypothetical protein